jgi:hypothetical protein
MPTNTSATGGPLAPATPYPADDDALDTALQLLIVGVTGLDGKLVRPRWQAIPQKRPEANINWCAVGVTSDTPDAGPSITYDPVNDNAIYTRHEDIMALASFYGPLAKTNAAILRDGLAVPQNLEPLGALAMSLIETGPIVALNELINQTWFKRRDMTIHLRRKVTRTYPILSFASSSGATVSDVPPITETFTTPP